MFGYPKFIDGVCVQEFTNDDLEENSNSNEPGPDDLDIYMDDILLVTTRNPKLVSFYDISNPNTFQLVRVLTAFTCSKAFHHFVNERPEHSQSFCS